jgi:hypothetical protein
VASVAGVLVAGRYHRWVSAAVAAVTGNVSCCSSWGVRQHRWLAIAFMTYVTFVHRTARCRWVLSQQVAMLAPAFTTVAVRCRQLTRICCESISMALHRAVWCSATQTSARISVAWWSWRHGAAAEVRLLSARYKGYVKKVFPPPL